jgi:quinol monooxygenase YgiN
MLGVLLTLAVKLPVTEADDLAPSMHWPAPVLDEHYDCDRGPVMVTIDYDIPLENAEVFRSAMQFVGAMRRRNGSLSWGLMQDSENPRLWHEFFFDESWLDHLRHHGRVTRAEQRIEAAARQYMTFGTEVRIRHFLGKPA